MIKELFLPQFIAGRYVLSQRIVGIDIARTYVSVSQIYLHNTTITIEKCINEPLEIGNNTNYEERVINTLKNIKSQLDHYDVLRTTIASSNAIIKELTLPFTQIEKIKMVLEYEVEPLLPFSANDAIIDGIVTKIIPEENKSLVLVAAIPKEVIAQHLQLLHAADLDPDVISIDFFDIYELYRMIPRYMQENKSHVLIDIESHNTRIGYVYNGALRIIRTLPKGIINQVKTTSDSLGMQPNAIMEQMMRHGFNHDDASFTKALTETFDAFWQDISFTLSSFTAQSNTTIDSIILFGTGSEINGLPEFITEKTGIACEKIQINEIIQQKNITLKQNGVIPQNCILSLATALSPENIAPFNLRKKEFTSKKTPLFIKQLITTGILSCTIIFGLIGYTIYQISALKSEVNASRTELSEKLIKQFNLRDDEADEDLETLIDTAKRKVTEKERIVFAFSGGHRVSFLQYLLELTTLIDKDAIDFKLNRLQIAQNTLTLEGSVRDFPADALKTLERDLRKSKLFTYTEQQQSPQFTIKIPLLKNGGPL